MYESSISVSVFSSLKINLLPISLYKFLKYINKPGNLDNISSLLK